MLLKRRAVPEAGVNLLRPHGPAAPGFAPAEDLAQHTRHILHRLSDAFYLPGSGKSTNLSLTGGAKKQISFTEHFVSPPRIFSSKVNQWQVYSERFLGL